MHYANLSANAIVTEQGINYFHIQREDDGTSFEHIQIPLIGYESGDYLKLDNGNMLFLKPFDLRIVNGKLFLLKGDNSKNHVLVLYSIPWNDDGFLGEYSHGKSPEAVFKLKAGSVFDKGYFHEYLFIIRKGIQYEFSYYSESTKNCFVILLKCEKGSDILVSKILRPLDFEF